MILSEGELLDFSITTYHCSISPNSLVKDVAFVMAIIWVLAPTLIIITTTAWLLCFVHRVRGLQKRQVVTLVAVSAMFCLSYIPFGTFFLLNKVVSSEEKGEAWFVEFYRFTMYALYVNYAANPVVYLFSVRSFRDFVVGGIAAAAVSDKSVSGSIGKPGEQMQTCSKASGGSGQDYVAK